MLSLNEYLTDPCGTLSIPYWKASKISVPPDMEILHERDFVPGSFLSHQRYFRLLHNLRSVCTPDLMRVHFATAQSTDRDTIVSVINRSYQDIQVTPVQIQGYRSTEVFDPDLWVLALHKDSEECVGCGIADFDQTAGELILEWIQVLPEFRRQGIGRAIVNELLCRGREKARFATVSGKLDDSSSPETLYRSCGFTGTDIWHICRK